MDNEIAKLPKTISVLEEYSKNRKDRAEIYNNFIETLKKLYNQNVDNNATLEAEKLGLAKEVKNLSKSIITNPNDNKTKEALDNFALRVNNLESKVKTKNTTNKTDQQPVSNQQVAQQKTNQKEQQQQVKQPVTQQPVAQQVQPTIQQAQPVVLSQEEQEINTKVKELKKYVQDQLARIDNEKRNIVVQEVEEIKNMVNISYNKQISFYAKYNNLIEKINNENYLNNNDKIEFLEKLKETLTPNKTGCTKYINDINKPNLNEAKKWFNIYNKQINILIGGLEGHEIAINARINLYKAYQKNQQTTTKDQATVQQANDITAITEQKVQQTNNTTDKTEQKVQENNNTTKEIKSDVQQKTNLFTKLGKKLKQDLKNHSLRKRSMRKRVKERTQTQKEHPIINKGKAFLKKLAGANKEEQLQTKQQGLLK